MSIFKPNNLSPNMEEIIVQRNDDYIYPVQLDLLEYKFINADDNINGDKGKLIFSFLVHSKMSYVRSYYLSIANKNAVDKDFDEYILGEFYGVFQTPYKDGDTGVIEITYDEFLAKGIKIQPGEEYVWRLRLYEDVIGCEMFDFTLNYNDNPATISVNGNKYNSESAKEKFGIIIQTFDDVEYLKFDNLLHRQENNFKNIYIYSSGSSFNLYDISDVNYSQAIGSTNHYLNLENGYNKITWNNSTPKSFIVAYRSGYKSVIDDTYIGAGFLSGSTHNIMWIEQQEHDIQEDRYFGYDAYSDYMYDPLKAPSLQNINNSDFNPFGIQKNSATEQPSVFEKNINIDCEGEFRQTKITNVIKTSAECVYWNLPDLMCEYLNKYKDASKNDIPPGSNDTWFNLCEGNDTSAQKVFPFLGILFESTQIEKIYINKKDIPDFNKWKQHIADGNMWIKLKFVTSAGSENRYFQDDNSNGIYADEYIRNIYEKYIKIITCGVDAKGFYVGINPLDGYAYKILDIAGSLFGSVGRFYQYVNKKIGGFTMSAATLNILKIFEAVINKYMNNSSGIYIMKSENYVCPFVSCTFAYRQREKIVQVDKGLGKNNLTRVILENSMNVNKFMYGDKDNEKQKYRSSCCTNLLSDKFTKSQFYIAPDLKYIEASNSYIHIYRYDEAEKIEPVDITASYTQQYPGSGTSKKWTYDIRENSIYPDAPYDPTSQEMISETINSESYMPMATFVNNMKITVSDGVSEIDNRSSLQYDFSFDVNISDAFLEGSLVETNCRLSIVELIGARDGDIDTRKFKEISVKELDLSNISVVYDSENKKIIFNDAQNIIKNYFNRSGHEASLDDFKTKYFVSAKWTFENGSLIPEEKLTNWSYLKWRVQKIAEYDPDSGRIVIEGSMPREIDTSYKYQIFNKKKTTSDVENGDVTYTNYYYLYIEGILGNPFYKNYELLSTNFSPWELYSTGLTYKNINGIKNKDLDNCKLFIQPSVIDKDYYKDTRLNLYNKQDNVNIFLGTNIYNDERINSYEVYKKYKDFIIDELTEDQWLVTCRYDHDEWTKNFSTTKLISMLPEDNLVKPQINYKIYSNHVDSIPNGYFYVRNNKKIEMQFTNIRNGINYSATNNGVLSILDNSILIKSDVSDENYDITNIKNISNLKKYNYKFYKIGENNLRSLFFQTEDLYDDKYEIKLDWIVNGIYDVTITVYDEFDFEFQKTQRIEVNNTNTFHNIVFDTECKKQRVNLTSHIHSLSNINNKKIYIYKIIENNVLGMEIFESNYSDISDYDIFDYAVKSNERIKYILITKDDQGQQFYISSEYSLLKWDEWFLGDLNYDFDYNKYFVSDNSFYFKNNFSYGSINHHFGQIEQSTNSKYGRASYSNNRYDGGSFSCLLGDIDSNLNFQYNEPIEKLNYWRFFIGDKKIKLFKDPKGNVWIISIIYAPSYDTDQRSFVLPTKIEFNWQQIMSSNIPILKIEERV